MKRSEITTLENKLKFVLELVKNKNQGRTPLFRIRNMKNENSFILVSDDKAKTPLSDTNLSVASHPYSVKVNKGTFIITVGDSAGNDVLRKQYKFSDGIINSVNDIKFDFNVANTANDILNDLKKIDSKK